MPDSPGMGRIQFLRGAASVVAALLVGSAEQSRPTATLPAPTETAPPLPTSTPRPAEAPTTLPTATPLPTTALRPTPSPRAAEPARPSYTIQAALDYKTGTALVTERLHYTNNAGTALTSIAFTVVAQAYGAFTLSSAKVGGRSVRSAIDQGNLELTLLTPLEPGSAVDVRLDYRLDVPNWTSIRLGRHDGVMSLGNWYPTVQVYDRAKGDWPLYPYVETGDAFYSEAADYEVSLDVRNAPAELAVAHSGELISRSGNHFVLGGQRLREFALAISHLYLTKSTQVGGTTVTSYYLSNDAKGAELIHQMTVDALAWGNAHLGTYPYKTLAVAEGIDPSGGGQEYSTMIIYGSGEYNSSTSYLTYLSGHETFHQWFYGLVGDAQPVDGWLDEGLATYLGYQFLGSKMAPADFAALWQVDVVERYKAGVAKWGDPPQDSTIYYYVDNHHSFSVGYRKGALLHEEVRAALGTDAYYQLLRDYVAANRYGIATSADLLRPILSALPGAGPDIIRRYFSTRTVSALAVAAALPSARESGVAR